MLTLYWTPHVTERVEALGKLIKKGDSDDSIFSLEQRQKHCKDLERATADTFVLEELIKVS